MQCTNNVSSAQSRDLIFEVAYVTLTIAKQHVSNMPSNQGDR